MPLVNHNYVAPTWVNDGAPAIDAAELQAISNKLVTLKGAGKPTNSTQGQIGQQYIDTNTNLVYICQNVTGSTYIWAPVFLAPLQGTGAPTTSTVGQVGQLYIDTTAGKIYVCIAIAGNTYTWTSMESEQTALIEYAGTGETTITLNLPFTPRFIVFVGDTYSGGAKPNPTLLLGYSNAASGATIVLPYNAILNGTITSFRSPGTTSSVTMDVSSSTATQFIMEGSLSDLNTTNEYYYVGLIGRNS